MLKKASMYNSIHPTHPSIQRIYLSNFLSLYQSIHPHPPKLHIKPRVYQIISYPSSPPTSPLQLFLLHLLRPPITFSIPLSLILILLFIIFNPPIPPPPPPNIPLLPPQIIHARITRTPTTTPQFRRRRRIIVRAGRGAEKLFGPCPAEPGFLEGFEEWDRLGGVVRFWFLEDLHFFYAL